MSAPFGMTDDVVAIIGSGRGIGAGIGLVLGAAGAHVACVDVDRDVADLTAEQIRDTGGRASAHSADALDRAAVRAVFAEIAAAHGPLTGVVDVVGRSHIAPIAEVTDADWSSQFDINLRHQFIAAQEAVPHLAKTRGGYVAIASVNGLTSSPKMLGYGAAKAALMSMIRTFAVEFGPLGVRFNAVAPGLVRTPHADDIGFTTGPIAAAFREHIPLRELAEPGDVGGAAYYLLSKLGAYVSGQTIVVDGGSTANYFMPNTPW